MTTRFQDVTQFPQDIQGIARSLANIPMGFGAMEEVADVVVRHLYDMLRDSETGERQCSLVRLFKTCKRDELTPQLRAEIPSRADDNFRSLVLLGTCGEHPDWNSRHSSRGHRLISLESVEVVERIPMISNLVRMLGLNLNDVVSPNPELSIAGYYPLSVFYVDDAMNSPYIPAKDNFVIPYNIRSVVGFGGLLKFTDMFTIIMFFKVPVEEEIAAKFKDLAEQVHQLLLPFQEAGRVFKR